MTYQPGPDEFRAAVTHPVTGDVTYQWVHVDSVTGYLRDYLGWLSPAESAVEVADAVRDIVERFAGYDIDAFRIHVDAGHPGPSDYCPACEPIYEVEALVREVSGIPR